MVSFASSEPVSPGASGLLSPGLIPQPWHHRLPMSCLFHPNTLPGLAHVVPLNLTWLLAPALGSAQVSLR